MNVIDKLYTEWAWRTKSGVPNIKNPEDKAILDSIFEEIGATVKAVELNEIEPKPEAETDYDKAIIEALGEIPEVKGSYTVPNQTTSTTISNSHDKKFYKQLHNKKPGGDATIGKGELGLYWLYKYQKNNTYSIVKDNRGKDNPDLRIGDHFVEVKAYKGVKNANTINLGGITGDHKNLGIFKTIFGIGTLTQFFDPNQKVRKVILANNFTSDELVQACQEVINLSKIDLSELSAAYPIFSNLSKNIQTVLQATNSPSTAEEMAGYSLGDIAITKFKSKPGLNQFIVDISPDGDADWFMVTEDKLKTPDLYKYVFLERGRLSANYKAIFGT